ncbi:uncharacterized protein BO95DRAFT_515528 [Aspergillus brunneoviolaceus CBS 621.78]|uniref:Uncharacterized protein n=1 Tax=Aspergillus brunneoviolaceus CBS 621.78 TaxID=1450534 RepID=A0ACD1G5C8_9EURO|nr:hypothetical protein BO95DRAFT_515528 [Aspergillus brunneoviolaceus CBS 621.78]RAH44489.1 hypothetical protein BO95DRAFT_515528 [Aspergillus brunneoviolaceus CBS 621.78]
MDPQDINFRARNTYRKLLEPGSPFNWMDEASDDDMTSRDEISSTSSTETLTVSDEVLMHDFDEMDFDRPLESEKEEVSAGTSMDWSATEANDESIKRSHAIQRAYQSLGYNLNNFHQSQSLNTDGHGMELEEAARNDYGGLAPSPAFSEDVESAEVRLIRVEIDHEFSAREAYMNHVDESESVHHFNWFGDPVPQESRTPPAISLFFQLTDPKVPRAGDELRLKALMKNAMVYIDPVVVDLETRGQRLPGTITDFIEWASKLTFRYYSPHGWWRNDPRVTNDECLQDPGNPYDYLLEDFGVATGFVQNNKFPSTGDWFERQRSRLAELEQTGQNRHFRKEKEKSCKPSPLRESITCEPDEAPPQITASTDNSLESFPTRMRIMSNVPQSGAKTGLRQDPHSPDLYTLTLLPELSEEEDEQSSPEGGLGFELIA